MEALRLKWSLAGSLYQWSQFRITLIGQRNRIRIRIKEKSRIRNSITMKRWIRIRINLIGFFEKFLELSNSALPCRTYIKYRIVYIYTYVSYEQCLTWKLALVILFVFVIVLPNSRFILAKNRLFVKIIHKS